MLYYIGKDISVMLHFTPKTYAQGNPLFSFLHVNTMWKFKGMIAVCDRTVKEHGLEFI